MLLFSRSVYPKGMPYSSRGGTFACTFVVSRISLFVFAMRYYSGARQQQAGL